VFKNQILQNTALKYTVGRISSLRGYRLTRCIAMVFLFSISLCGEVYAQTNAARDSYSAAELLKVYRSGETTAAMQEKMEVYMRPRDLRAKGDDYFSILNALLKYYLDNKQHDTSWELLKSNRAQFVNVDREVLRAELFYRAGRLEYLLGRFDDSEHDLLQALKIFEYYQDAAFKAAIENELALVYVADERFDRAAAVFSRAYVNAKKAKATELQLQISLNQVKTAMDQKDFPQLLALLGKSQSLLQFQEHQAAVTHWVSLGRYYQKAANNLRNGAELRLKALHAYRKAESLDDMPYMLSYIYGYMGELYEDEGRYQDALTITRKAHFTSQEIDAGELSYQWEWQLGRLLNKLGKKEQALTNFRSSVATLAKVRTLVTVGEAIDFKTRVSPVYYQLAQALLAKSATVSDKDEQQQLLQEVIDSLEAMKLAEVENYFDSECVLLPEEEVNLSSLDSKVAVLYPVLLPNRTELILQFADEIQRFSIAVDFEQLGQEVLEFRKRIESYQSDNSYQKHAQQLYQWIIKPIESSLREAEIDTLVFVPDGPLRTIPIAALHNGKSFLIEEYAIAITPGMTLMDPKPLQRKGLKILAHGLIEAVQGYAALPSVEKELIEIAKIFPGQQYLDSNFQLKTTVEQMSNDEFSVVHFATHGEFNRDHSKSFLLTYDDKLTMNRLVNSIALRRFGSDPLELLVLSACQTAVGDDQAALGLAGVAIKAGARSALATLWFISDESTTELVARFYRQLSKSGVSKAKALQIAQIDLITNTRYKHPSFWAPFLLIGNWM